MTNADLLKKLTTLQNLESADREAFIKQWIFDTKSEIAKESSATVGYGDGAKTIAKEMKLLLKTCSPLAGMLKVTGQGIRGPRYIFTNKSYAVMFKNDLGFNVIDNSPDLARNLYQQIQDCKSYNTESVVLPTRAMLDTIIKEWKAEDKHSRTPSPIYTLDTEPPIRYDAQQLYNLLSIVPARTGAIDLSKGRMSKLYLSFYPYTAILMPLN